jgi:RHS repeat-associated protein
LPVRPALRFVRTSRCQHAFCSTRASLSAGTITYLVTDSLGSVRGTVSSSGALTGTCSYDAWGNPETASGLTATTPFGYTDPDGLVYLLNRYYQPSTGQFISVDPELATTLAAYAYADGNPVANIDPTGLISLSCHWTWLASFCRATVGPGTLSRLARDLSSGGAEMMEAGGSALICGAAGFIFSPAVAYGMGVVCSVVITGILIGIADSFSYAARHGESLVMKMGYNIHPSYLDHWG